MAQVVYRGVSYDTDRHVTRRILRSCTSGIPWRTAQLSHQGRGGTEMNFLALIQKRILKERALYQAQLVMALR